MITPATLQNRRPIPNNRNPLATRIFITNKQLYMLDKGSEKQDRTSLRDITSKLILFQRHLSFY